MSVTQHRFNKNRSLIDKERLSRFVLASPRGTPTNDVRALNIFGKVLELTLLLLRLILSLSAKITLRTPKR
jgi:hypothetical protein